MSAEPTSTLVPLGSNGDAGSSTSTSGLGLVGLDSLSAEGETLVEDYSRIKDDVNEVKRVCSLLGGAITNRKNLMGKLEREIEELKSEFEGKEEADYQKNHLKLVEEIDEIKSEVEDLQNQKIKAESDLDELLIYLVEAEVDLIKYFFGDIPDSQMDDARRELGSNSVITNHITKFNNSPSSMT
ncbi:hypothetical protein BDEG_27931 [Batrachochytrium dendrobatidis JEL423]|uniref:Uncharacterized protein n=1 Tax=Batrachochytrium dendrobatidis (strain JEL423) TaxID=403673 RepID=A0A177WZ85_BATDL|nr:hypothetical protein BDEG_27931 [Batrachochytrium dendrobatidis JEL423]